jgi:phage baseplate assembly protein W
MAAERQLLIDIRLGLRHQRFRPVYSVDEDRRRVPARAGLLRDLGMVSGRDNLAQAVFLRLLTPRGELAELGHPEYGSRLHELIGRVNNETTRNLVKLFILESLQLEPRIAEIVEVTVTAVEGSRTREEVRHLVNVLVRVRPIAETAIVTIGPFVLELD